jgi:hypothetical protein
VLSADTTEALAFEAATDWRLVHPEPLSWE